MSIAGTAAKKKKKKAKKEKKKTKKEKKKTKQAGNEEESRKKKEKMERIIAENRGKDRKHLEETADTGRSISFCYYIFRSMARFPPIMPSVHMYNVAVYYRKFM